MEPTHRKRCKRHYVYGDAHCLTFSCLQRLPLFTRERSCRWMCDALELGRSRSQFDFWAYVIMPEHVHVVLLPRAGARMSEVLTTLKQSVSKRALIWLAQNVPEILSRLEDARPNGVCTRRFWQRGGGYDRNPCTVSDVHEKIQYVHANPVRRGPAAQPEDWHGSSCRAWEVGEDGPVALDRDSFVALMPTDSRKRRSN